VWYCCHKSLAEKVSKIGNPVMIFSVKRSIGTAMFIAWTVSLYMGQSWIRDKTDKRVAYILWKNHWETLFAKITTRQMNKLSKSQLVERNLGLCYVRRWVRKRFDELVCSASWDSMSSDLATSCSPLLRCKEQN